jgi:endonuclease-8
MPEGHTIHRLAELHTKLLVGHRLGVSSPQGRFADGAKQVDKQALRDVTPHGKHLFYRFNNGRTVHVHLGLHGAFRTVPMPPRGQPLPEARGAVRMRLVGGGKIVELTGPTACETLDGPGVAKIRDRLGPDVLDPAADAGRVWDKVHKSRSPIGYLLMDQSVVSGIGNVYRSEVLYRQRVHPLTPGSSLKREQFDRIWRDSVDLLNRGMTVGHIVTTEPADVGGVAPADTTFDQRFLIYRRPTCRRCGAPVRQFTLAGRECFVCPNEQRAPFGLDLSRFDLQPVAEPKVRRGGRKHGDADEE